MKNRKIILLLFLLSYLLIEGISIINSGIEYKVIIRQVLAIVLYYFLYLGKNWARIAWLVILAITIFSFIFVVIKGYTKGLDFISMELIFILGYSFMFYLLNKRDIIIRK